MKCTAGAKAKLRVIDRATGNIAQETGWQHNLVLDVGLNAMANGGGFGSIFQNCKVGSSNAPNVIASGAVTFTQSGNTITASNSFFTSGMTGAILKYGSGSSGLEQYITYVDSTHATSTTSTTVGSPIAGTVYLVQQTSLVAYLYKATSYQTGSANCGTTLTSTSCVMKRTLNFPNQASPYTVNEIGYSSNGNNDGTCLGRIVLNSGVTVSATQFLQVIVIFTFVVNPNTPTAVANVGTNINTAGNVMYQVWDCTVVDNNGNNVSNQGSFPGNMMDLCQNIYVGLVSSAVSQNSTILNQLAATTAVIYQLGNGSVSNAGQAVGVGLASFTYAITTAGETIAGIVMGAQIGGGSQKTTFSLNFTTPQTLPVGTFSGTFTFTNTFTRTLVN
jgi:hypothetical protein